MSHLQKPAEDTNIFAELSSVTVENKTTTASGMDQTPKRGAPDQGNNQIKKIKVEQNSEGESKLTLNRKFDQQLSFIPASQVAARRGHTTVGVIPEISDEELLAMAIEFEKKHPEFN